MELNNVNLRKILEKLPATILYPNFSKKNPSFKRHCQWRSYHRANPVEKRKTLNKFLKDSPLLD